jgi:hypothetical protein
MDDFFIDLSHQHRQRWEGPFIDVVVGDIFGDGRARVPQDVVARRLLFDHLCGGSRVL